MSSMNYVVHQLQELGLSAEVHGETVYCEDIDLDFDRSHDGVRGVSRWLAETREEYNEAIAKLLEGPEEDLAIKLDEDGPQPPDDDVDEEWAIEFAETKAAIEEEEETVTDAQDEAESYSEDAPCHTQAGDHGEEVKPHFFGSPLDDPAMERMSPKEIAQATEVDDQDRGGIPSPETHSVVVLVKGQRFLAPEGWRIKESRPSGKVLFYGSVYQARKTENEARGAEFSLVRV